MLRMDRKKPFGTITPPMQDPDMDRAAFYDQEGKLFDAQDREIVRGEPLARPDAEQSAIEDNPLDLDGDGKAGGSLSVGKLLAQADTLPWMKFKANAKLILGETCPPGKAAMIEALKQARAAYDERNAGRRARPQATQAAAIPAPPGGVDLAAWGRGQSEYLFAEVRKAIRAKFSRVAITQKDAIDVLLDEKIITAAEARDVA